MEYRIKKGSRKYFLLKVFSTTLHLIANYDLGVLHNFSAVNGVWWMKRYCGFICYAILLELRWKESDKTNFVLIRLLDNLWQKVTSWAGPQSLQRKLSPLYKSWCMGGACVHGKSSPVVTLISNMIFNLICMF